MPNYTFHDTRDDHVFTISMSIAEMEQYLKDEPWIRWVPVSGLPTLDSVRLGIRKPDENFRDVLRTIKKGSPNSKINTF